MIRTEKPTTSLRRSSRMPGPRAFTFIELVVVLFLAGIVALLAAPSLHQNLVESEVDQAAAELTGIVRYARSLAVTGTPHSVVADLAGGRIYVWDDVSKTIAPGQVKQGQCALQFGAAGRFENVRLVSADFAGSQKVSFDVLGNAAAGGTIVIAAGDFTRTVRVAGPGGRVDWD